MESVVYSRGSRCVHSFSQEGRKGRRQVSDDDGAGGSRCKRERSPELWTPYPAGTHKISSGEGPSIPEGEKGHGRGTAELGQQVQRQRTERVAKHPG